jgi:hypothetical protein
VVQKIPKQGTYIYLCHGKTLQSRLLKEISNVCVRRPVVTPNVGMNGKASQSQLYVNIILHSWQHVLAFNYQPSSDTDKNTRRNYTHIQHTVQLVEIASLHCSQMLVLLTDRTAYVEN